MSQEIEKNFYYNVGILSTRFAIAEQLCQDILCLTISSEERHTATLTIIEEFTLWKTLRILEKIIKINSGWEKEIKAVIKKLDKIRVVRNLFIHGLWKTPQTNGKTTTISVETKKIKFEEEPPIEELVKQGYPYSYGSRTWRFNNYQTFSIEEIQRIISETNDIINLQEKIISDIKDKLQL